jgi:shikimate kinase
VIEYGAKKDNIYITGFMGVGKTTVGRQLASDLSWTFIDLDQAVENASHRPINSIIVNEGLGSLRKMEEAILETIATQQHHIVALGAGALLNSKSMEVVRNSGALIYLHAEVPILIRRIENDHSKRRPLIGTLSGKTLESKIGMLLQKRRATYQKADMRIDTDELDIPSVIHEIEKRRLSVSRAS